MFKRQNNLAILLNSKKKWVLRRCWKKKHPKTNNNWSIIMTDKQIDINEKSPKNNDDDDDDGLKF